MNGMDATRNLRALGIRIPLIAVTGNALDDDQSAFRDAGIDTILTKPVARAGLQACLKEYLPALAQVASAAQIKMRRATPKWRHN